MDDKKLNQRLLEHAINYYGINRFKRLFSVRYKKELKKGGKGFIPNRVLMQMVNMEAYYGPYKEDEPKDN
ncbi:hypothetical protein [Brachyspira sp.]|uniref:hypothetical protein n=1 Tax=Brachyspira sp. TaxID=1977261 RepID=UPI003D7D3BD5